MAGTITTVLARGFAISVLILIAGTSLPVLGQSAEMSNINLDQLVAACGSPGCTVRIPPGVFTFSTQIAPTVPVLIEGSGASYENAGTHCTTTLEWIGPAVTPISISSTGPTGTILRGFCIFAITGAGAPPAIIDVSNGAGNVTLDHVVIDYNTLSGKVLPTVACFRWGATGPAHINDESASNLFTRGCPVGYSIDNLESIFVGDHIRAAQNTNFDLVLGANSLVENFFCNKCSWSAATPAHVNIQIDDVTGVDLTDNEYECGNGTAAYCLDVPSTATQAQGLDIKGGQIFGEIPGGTPLQAAIHVALPGTQLSVANVLATGSNVTWATPSYLVKDDTCTGVRITIVGSDFTPTGAQIASNNNCVYIWGVSENGTLTFPSTPTGYVSNNSSGISFNGAGGLKAKLITVSSAYTLAPSDSWVKVTGTTTLKVPHVQTGQLWHVFNSGASTVTLQCDSGNINGAGSITLAANTGKAVTADGTNCFAH